MASILSVLKFFNLCLYLTSFLFLTGFVQLPAVMGPAITIATSGNLAKATAQFIFDYEFKKKTGKSSLNYITEEVSKNNQQMRINKDFKNFIKDPTLNREVLTSVINKISDSNA